MPHPTEVKPHDHHTTDPLTPPVLVVGATAFLGNKVVDDLKRRGVEIARGDMLDLTSLEAAMRGADVPHFWHKKLAEDKLEQLGVPFVALRPGAFLDQVASMAGNPVAKRRMIWPGNPTVPLTFVHTSDLAAYLAAAVDADVRDGERIDIGWDRPVSARELAGLIGDSAGSKHAG